MRDKENYVSRGIKLDLDFVPLLNVMENIFY